MGSKLRSMAAAVLVVATSAACASGARSTGTGAPGSRALVPQAAAPKASPADVQFLSGMIHHHAQAIVMSEWSATHGASQQIRVLSERIIVSQRDEIKMMQQWLREHGEPAPEPSPRGQRMVMGGTEHHMLMAGMLTEEQMAQLDRARGTEFDRLFLAFMIQHHRGAQKMVEELFAAHGGGVDDLIYKIASDTFADQGSEIDRMQRMLDAMGASGR
ncbi:MAG: DUF305 domain-containing protein [Longimicrobiales bacterium]